MEVVNARAALLSNHEVLSLLQELEAEHLTRTKTIQRIKKEEEASGTLIPGNSGSVLETSENLRTIQVEAIGYLSADYLPTSTQTSAGVTRVVKALEPYTLTKAENLQIVNLAPTTPVELYVIVEELEDRLGDRMEELLEGFMAIQDTTSSVPVIVTATVTNGVGEDLDIDTVTWENFGDDADAVYDEEMFDDTGEGAGVEGDLDADDD